MTLLWTYDLAQTFWRSAGGEPHRYPRDLRLPIARAFALTPVGLPDLCVDGVDRWLRDCGIACTLNVHDRPLRACLVAFSGSGAIFLDSADRSVEQRFSLAHELAHFLHDYLAPRHEAIRKLGPAILPVLDGEREPSAAERMHALLARAPLGFMVHLMERTPDGALAAGVAIVEDDADRLALELLAPEDVVRNAMQTGDPTDRNATRVLLEAHFGLPATQAALYAARLSPEERQPLSFLERLQRAR
jgi:hypothetical protein